MADSKDAHDSPGEAGLAPDSKPNAVEELHPSNEERAIDVGESGQYAPGGRYNELGATKTRRIDLDEQVDSALSGEEK
jgi:hypothetical protein